MSYREAARRLQALETRADEETRARYTAIIWSMTDAELDAFLAAIGGISQELQALSDDELARYAAEERVTYEDYNELRTWLEEHRAAFA